MQPEHEVSWAKKTAFIAIILLTLAMTGAIMAYRLALGRAYLRFSRAEAPPPSAAPAPQDDLRIARGEHLIGIMGCQSCHGPQLRGGVVREVAQHYRIVAPDLVGTDLGDDVAFERFWQALRLGLDEDQRALWAMPRTALLKLANDDVLALCEALLARRRATRAQAHSPVRHPRGYVGGRGYLDLLSGSLVLVDDAVPAPPEGGWPMHAPPAATPLGEAYEQQLRYRARASRDALPGGAHTGDSAPLPEPPL